MGLFVGKAEQKTQLFFRDDRKFIFRKLPLEHSCIVEKKDGKLVRAWKHFYGAEIPFAGYKNISADAVTLGFNRDIILDPFNKIKVGDEVSKKPSLIGDSLNKWIARIAENMRHVYRGKRTTRTTGDVVTWLIVGIDCLMGIGWAIRFMTG